MPTLEDIKQSLLNARIPNDGILLRATNGSTNFLELHQHVPIEAIDEIIRLTPLVQAGIEEFTPCHKLALLILKAHYEQGHPITPYARGFQRTPATSPPKTKPKTRKKK